MRQIDEIIIHCSATRPDWWKSKSAKQKLNEVRKWHLNRGWSDVGYHYMIDRDGTVVVGRDVERAGAHVLGHNKNSIGICLFGGHGSSASDKFQDNFTPDQEAALVKLIAKLREDFPSIVRISGHNQYSAKACPGFSVPAWMEGKAATGANPLVVSKNRSTPAQSRTVQASVVQGASAVGGAVGALNALDGTAQIVALLVCGVVLVMAGWIFKERLRKWAEGDR
jgi:hypothetical protein